ncbi:unnamed protein product [Prorocentrum cordatum]|uniref:Uncharacterized protein n=1 Tax=Prorocentrum cordatum TaxID=2364126 RepID=A0ABN9WX42_9DINO|nr:unnamed protein product [Polarella glacialis]
MIADQKKLLGTMKCTVSRFNGSVGQEEMIVKWETKADWHRNHRSDVRKYVRRSNMVNSFFLVGGFGLWLPRLAFEEKVLKTGGRSSKLEVGVWYEFDDAYIGWPTDNLKNLTEIRWNKFYDQYSAAIRNVLNLEKPWDAAPAAKAKPKPKGQAGPKAEL